VASCSGAKDAVRKEMTAAKADEVSGDGGRHIMGK
jgi:hypothetical protein